MQMYTGAALIAFVVIAVRLWWLVGLKTPLIFSAVAVAGCLVWSIFKVPLPSTFWVCAVGIVMGVIERAKSNQAKWLR